MPSPAQWATSSASGFSEREPDLTARQRALVMSGSELKYRTPQYKRAKLITATGDVDAEGRPLPSDHSKPKTFLTLTEIYAIAQKGDRSVMREYPELFITTGTNAFETKAEYAWVYLRANDQGHLPITEDRLKALFPEWDMVLNPGKESPLASRQSNRITRSFKQEPSDSVEGLTGHNSPIADGSYPYSAVGPDEMGDTMSSAELQREVWKLRNENWHLQREVCLLRDDRRKSLSELQQSQPLSNKGMRDFINTSNAFTGLPGPAVGKRTSEMAFGEAGGYSLGPGGRPIPNLNPEIEQKSFGMHHSYAREDPYCGNWGYKEQSRQMQMQRRGIFDQQEEIGNGPLPQVSRCIPEQVRSRVLNSLSSEDDLTKLTLHGYGQFAACFLPNAQPFATSSTFTNNVNMDNPFVSTGEPFRAQEANWGAELPEYPELGDQIRVDSQLLHELQSSNAKEDLAVKAPAPHITKPESTESIDALIDPLFATLSSQPEPSQDMSSLMTKQSSQTDSSLVQAALEGPSPEDSQNNPTTGSLKTSRKCLAVLNDPQLADDPIRKFHEELDSFPPGIPKKYGSFKVQSQLPDHLLHHRPDQRTVSDEDLRSLLDFGPSVRGLFAKYFRVRDGYIKPEYRHLLDEVDPMTGEFRLPALQIYSLDPQMVPHYINRHYPEFRLQ